MTVEVNDYWDYLGNKFSSCMVACLIKGIVKVSLLVKIEFVKDVLFRCNMIGTCAAVK